MDRIIRRIVLWIMVIVVAYTLYVIVDYIRLTDPDGDFKKPFLTFSEEYTRDTVTYNGLGYKVVYRRYWRTEHEDECDGAEVYLFDKFFIGGWIE